MLRCFRNTQTQPLGARLWQQPQTRGSRRPTRPVPARPAGAETEPPSQGQGEGPTGQHRTPPFPALWRIWSLLGAVCGSRRSPVPQTRGFGRARPAPRHRAARGAGTGEGAGGGGAGGAVSPGPAGLRSTGARQERLSPAAAAAPRRSVAMGPGLALPAAGKWRAGREGPGRTGCAAAARGFLRLQAALGRGFRAFPRRNGARTNISFRNTQ